MPRGLQAIGNGSPARADFPQTLFIETTTRCNLACPMCVKNQPGWQGGAGDMDYALYERLGPDFRQARAVILNGMGEPLMHPDLPRMVALAKAGLPEGGWCGLQTNALLFDWPLADQLVRPWPRLWPAGGIPLPPFRLLPGRFSFRQGRSLTKDIP